MATASYTWQTWSGSTWEVLADAGNSANIIYAKDTTDVAAKFTCTTKGTNQTEYGRKSGSGDSYESIFSVPAGSVITAIQCTAWKYKRVAVSKLTSQNIVIKMIDDAAGTVATVISSTSLGTSTDSTYQSGSAGTNQTGLEIASNVNVRLSLELAMVVATSSGTASVDTRFDDVTIQVTYTPPYEVNITNEPLHISESVVWSIPVGDYTIGVDDHWKQTEELLTMRESFLSIVDYWKHTEVLSTYWDTRISTSDQLYTHEALGPPTPIFAILAWQISDVVDAYKFTEALSTYWDTRIAAVDFWKHTEDAATFWDTRISAVDFWKQTEAIDTFWDTRIAATDYFKHTEVISTFELLQLDSAADFFRVFEEFAYTLGTGDCELNAVDYFRIFEEALTTAGGPFYCWGYETPASDEYKLSWAEWKHVGGGGSPVTVDGDANYGSMLVDTDCYGPVVQANPPGDKAITVTKNKYGASSDNYKLYIRGDTSSFAWDAVSPSWMEYTGSTTQNWTYLQIKFSQV